MIECIPERYEFILERNEYVPNLNEYVPKCNEYVPNRNENIPDRYWNLGKPKLPKNLKFFREFWIWKNFFKIPRFYKAHTKPNQILKVRILKKIFQIPTPWKISDVVLVFPNSSTYPESFHSGSEWNSFHSGMNSYRSGIHSFRYNFSHSVPLLWPIVTPRLI